MKKELVLFFYQAAYGCLFPFILLLLVKRKDTRKRLLSLLGLIRSEAREITSIRQNMDWFHAVSFGETKLAMHFISYGIKNRMITRPIVFTTTIENSLQYALNFMHKHHPDHEFYAFFHPLDFFIATPSLFRCFAPKRFFLFETDFWPWTTSRLKKAGCKCFLINGRVSPGIQQVSNGFRDLFLPLFQSYTVLFCQSKDTQNYFQKLGLAKSAYLANQMKVDLLPTKSELTPFFSISCSSPMLVFGSFHQNEWTDLLPMLKTAQNKAVLVLVPRNVNEATWFLNQCLKENIEASMACRGQHITATASVLIIDSMGELNAIYSQASLCIVGGSFSSYGGHNFLEPLALKKPVMIGPDTRNFSEDVSEYLSQGLIRQAQNGQNGSQQIQEFLSNPKSFIEMSLKAWENLQTKLGVTQATWEIIQKKS